MLLLNIDTATEHASVCLSKNDQLLAIEESTEQKNHASFLQPAIEKLARDTGIKLSDLNAVAVTIGPGSYTGLRVGLASAKGICFALDKPLIAINTLQVMAQAALNNYRNTGIQTAGVLFCPLIDARRMEVFTAVYNDQLDQIGEPRALILAPDSFENLSKSGKIVFGGSGSDKLKKIINQGDHYFSDAVHNAADMLSVANASYNAKNFADLAYCSPLYVKEFFDTSRRSG